MQEKGLSDTDKAKKEGEGMKVSELIEILEEVEDRFGDVDVGIAEQPSYPFRYSIMGVTFDDELDKALIVEGTQEAYGKKEWFDEEGMIE